MTRRLRITVDGKAYDVVVEEMSEDPDDAGGAPVPAPAATAAAASVAAAAPAAAAAPRPATAPPGDGEAQRAPLAGTIVSVAVKAGDVVAADQQLCVIEAMKMKTAINAIRAGTVAAVLVGPGDAVDSDQPLVTFR